MPNSPHHPPACLSELSHATGSSLRAAPSSHRPASLRVFPSPPALLSQSCPIVTGSSLSQSCPIVHRLASLELSPSSTGLTGLGHTRPFPLSGPLKHLKPFLSMFLLKLLSLFTSRLPQKCLPLKPSAIGRGRSARRREAGAGGQDALWATGRQAS